MLWFLACHEKESRKKFKFAGGSPAAGIFLLLAQKKDTKEKSTQP
jgi:hypothetical protein